MRMDIDVLYPEAIGDDACVLAACPSEADQRIVSDVVASFDADFFYGVSHVVRGDI